MIEDPGPNDPIQCADCQGRDSRCQTCQGQGTLPLKQWMSIFLPQGNFPGAELQTKDKRHES